MTEPAIDELLILTGSDAGFFPNLRVVIGSWLENMTAFPLAVCDFGMTDVQKRELERVPGLYLLELTSPPNHPWLGKSLAGKFVGRYPLPWEILMWIDADALFASPLPPLAPLLEDYDMLADAHIQGVGEIAPSGRRDTLNLRDDDAYFSAGWWVARRGILLQNYELLCSQVEHRERLWEGDAFVAAIYREKLKIRTVCGSIWHSRGKTSLFTCDVEGLVPMHAHHPIYILHANAGYARRADGRRVLKNQKLAQIQDYYERTYIKRLG
jgi:hypothetical protein